jgi:hypothetical protein
MPAKISTISYIYDSTEQLAQDYTVKKIMVVLRLHDSDATKVNYLKLFIPSDQNCFTLTVYKTQGLTLLRVCLALDGNIFSPGQTYVVLSRCTWEISHLDRSTFMIDQDVVTEYQRLSDISNTHPYLFLDYSTNLVFHHKYQYYFISQLNHIQ